MFLLNRIIARNGINLIKSLDIKASSKILSLNSIKFNQVLQISTNDKLLTSNKNEPQKLKIYTKTGDKGKSSLFTGERRPKNDFIFDALGNTDELNSNLGLVREFCLDISSTNSNLADFTKQIESKIIKIQSTLLDVGSFIATPKTKAQAKQLERLAQFDSKLTSELEKWIDEYELELPPLKNFILPSGGKCASSLHISRSVCRRLERSLLNLTNTNDLDPNILPYVNRLSDFLFVCARYCSMKEGKIESIYKKQN